MKDETEEEQYEDGVVVKTLGEVCQIKCGNHSTKKSNFIEGDYLIIGGGKQPIGKHNEYNCDENTILCASHGTAGYISMYPVKTFLTMAFAFIENKQLINKMYLYYYLKSIEEHLISLGKGTAQPCISMDKLKSIKIPIPSLERQQEIVKYLDFIYEKANKTSNEKIAELKQLNEFCLSNQKIFGENVVKELGDVFKEVKTGKDVVATERKKGEYPFYGANGIIDYVDSYIFDGKYLLTARTGSLGSLHISTGKFWCSGDVHRMEFENDTLLSYTYYYLQTIDFQKFRTGSAHPKLSGSSLKSIKIHIPTLERQKEIVEYCENNDTLIKQLEKEIENNKRLAQQFITGIVKSKDKPDLNIINSEESSEPELEEIEIKDKIYLLDGINVYMKKKDGSKGEHYGTYKNEKFKKLSKEIEV